MQSQENTSLFDQQNASSYDKQWIKTAAFKEALHLSIRLVLSDLPSDAKILCVGAGTGAELVYLAREFPEWQFTIVEPAIPMLDICRKRAKENGISSRCVFHWGYINELPETNSHHAATCLLVSQFLINKDERRDLFKNISIRLRDGGYLINADLASDMSSADFESLFEVWVKMLKYCDIPDKQIEEYSAAYQNQVAVLPPSEIEAIIQSGGFEKPILFSQTLLIHAWYSKKISN